MRILGINLGLCLYSYLCFLRKEGFFVDERQEGFFIELHITLHVQLLT